MARTKFTKRERDDAKRRGDALFACALESSEVGKFGNHHVSGNLRPEMANALFAFATAIQCGAPSKVAFDNVLWPDRKDPRV